MVRFRQCLVEYLSSPALTDRRAFLNAIKYATAFPVIFLSAAQRQVIAELAAQKGSEVTRTPWHGEHHLFRLWLLALAINSIYSFWWDVTNDWGLTLLRPNGGDGATTPLLPSSVPPTPAVPKTPLSPIWSEPSTPSRAGLPPLSIPQNKSRGLRPVLLFNDPILYYVAIGFNLILRFTWSLRLSSHLHTLADIEGGVFLLEALEIMRRWVWVFFRVEWETVKKTKHGHAMSMREISVELIQHDD